MAKRGLTIIEINVVIISTAVLIVLSSCGLGRARNQAMITKDQVQARAIQAGFSFWTPSHNGRFPIPGLEARLAVDGGNFVKGRGKEDLTQNDHAALLSMCVMQGLFSTDVLFAPTEQGDFIYPMENYDYNSYDPAPSGSGWSLWDVEFVNDLTTGSNNSYGILPVSGVRKDQNWGVTSNDPSSFITLGTRGPVNGEPDPYSRANLLHGNQKTWKGVAAFVDGHAEVLETFYPKRDPYNNISYMTKSGESVADNIFLEEQDQEIDAEYMPGGLALGQGADIILTHVKSGDAIAKGKGGAAVAFLHD